MVEKCVDCGTIINGDEAIETAEWLTVEVADYSLDEGPRCSACARKRRHG